MAPPRQGWFHTENRPGERSLEQQLAGLDELAARVKGKSVLDIGCAEGLIGIHLIDQGAVAVHGLEIVPERVKLANRLRGDRACTFEAADVNTYHPVREYDVVLLLAILHKLSDPYNACRRLADAARELVVIRLPAKEAPHVVDRRSRRQRYDIDAAMQSEGFERQLVVHGPLGEWTAYYNRVLEI